MRILHLYRPRIPGQRAQAIQVVHTCHALARRGHRVTLLADRGHEPAKARRALEVLGLDPIEGFDLRIAPFAHSGLAGLWFRRQLKRWWSGPPGVVLARDKKRLFAALDTHERAHRIVLETHELDSALLRDRNEEHHAMVVLEKALAGTVDALVANCGGTLAAWEDAGYALPSIRRVCHNACAPSRSRLGEEARDPVIRILGSARRYKGVSSLLNSADTLPLPLEWLGATESERARWTDTPNLRFLPPIPYPQVPDLLARSQVLFLPLEDNRFGRSLTSPLKLWDYLATGVPIVAPALPSVLEIQEHMGVSLHLYEPGNESDRAHAIRLAMDAPRREPSVRSWDQRAAELEEVLQ